MNNWIRTRIRKFLAPIVREIITERIAEERERFGKIFQESIRESIRCITSNPHLTLKQDDE